MDWKGLRVRPWLDRLATEARTVLGPKIELTVEMNQPLVVLGDANQLHQIFMNMAVNARDAMPGSGHLKVTAAAVAPGSTFPFGVVPEAETFAHLAIADDGHGMSPEILGHMYEPLFTTKKTGTGLGLALALQVVKQLGGSIFVESEPGRGTTFHVFLPLGSKPQLERSRSAAWCADARGRNPAHGSRRRR